MIRDKWDQDCVGHWVLNAGTFERLAREVPEFATSKGCSSKRVMDLQVRVLVLLLLAVTFDSGKCRAGDFDVASVVTDLSSGAPVAFVELTNFAAFLETSKPIPRSEMRGRFTSEGVFFTTARKGYYWYLRGSNYVDLTRLRNPDTPSRSLESRAYVSTNALLVLPHLAELKAPFVRPVSPLSIINHWNQTPPLQFEMPKKVEHLILTGASRVLRDDEALMFRAPQHIQGNPRGNGYLLDGKTNIYFWNIVSDRSVVVRNKEGQTAVIELPSASPGGND